MKKKKEASTSVKETGGGKEKGKQRRGEGGREIERIRKKENERGQETERKRGKNQQGQGNSKQGRYCPWEEGEVDEAKQADT